MQPIPGQRWTSDTEPELGLGTVIGTEGRTVSLIFIAVGERRTYAMANMPLSRVAFEAGDRIEHHEGWSLAIDSVEEQEGLLTYHGQKEDGATASMPEGELSCFLQFNRPLDRLFAGQIDDNHWFELRYETLQQINRLEQLPVWGLCGGRTSLLPHQLYIAHEVANRNAPRVLLADEVGLGKTIEACMILHHQLLTGRAQRALIIVPEPLIHQWLVELLRRFNLHFSIYDEKRCQAIEKSGQASNPFQANQLALCSLNLFTDNPQRQQQVLQGEWDLLIVDEAHHLQWSEQGASPEYQIIEQLAKLTRSILLLTATPEQLGRAGHFARLRLLDPDRFHDLATFREEEAQYQPVAETVELLLSNQPLPEEDTRRLLELLGESEAAPLLSKLTAASSERNPAKEQLITMLLDRHGTGRVLFRNTRKRVKGFPERQLRPAPLPIPPEYEAALQALLEQAKDDESLDAISMALTQVTPETLYDTQAGDDDRPWWHIDPRVDWLISTARTLAKKKILVICALPETAIELEEALRLREGIHCALFHEHMSIIERDRAAAWFADSEDGCQFLICSEIGSEGRNFQFAHHLVLFDLPIDPDLLEQRIGRLDRIGQRERIHIHAPYLQGSAQEVLLHWLHTGLDAFEDICPAGHGILKSQGSALIETIQRLAEEGHQERLDKLVANTKQQRIQAQESLQQGRDHLLEMSSCRSDEAEHLRGAIHALDTDATLGSYLEQVLSCYGVSMEEHSLGNYILRPTEHMHCEAFPELPAEGITCTFQRETALSHEDRHFLTWEHPLVEGAMEMILNEGVGNCCVATLEHQDLEPGTLLVETLFVLESVAPRALRIGRFLPPTTLRSVLDDQGNNLADHLPHTTLRDNCLPVERNTAANLVRQRRKLIKKQLELAESAATTQVANIIKAAQSRTLESYTKELRRLAALQQVNPNIRGEEIDALKQELRDLHQHLQSAHLRLEAVRILVSC